MLKKQTKPAGWVILLFLSVVVSGYMLRCLAQKRLLLAPHNKASRPTPADRDILLLASFRQSAQKDASKRATRILNVPSVTLLSPDGKTAVGIWNIPDGGGHMAVYDMTTGKTRFHADLRDGYIEGMTFAPDSQSFVTGWRANTVRHWNSATGQVITEFDLKKQQWGRPLAISSDGKTLVSGDYYGTVQLWNLADGQALRSFRGHTAPLWGAAFSPDGQTLATCGEDRTARLWNVATGHLRFTLQGHQDKIYCLAFSHDGKTLATGSADRQIKLWETQTGFAQRTLVGHKEIVFSLAFSSNDGWLASGSLDKTARLWEVSTGHLERTFEAGYGGVPVIAFWEGDTHLAVTDGDTLSVWPITLSKLP